MRWLACAALLLVAIAVTSCRIHRNRRYSGAGERERRTRGRAVRSGQECDVDLGAEGGPLFREESRPVRAGARACGEVSGRGRGQVWLPRKIRRHALDADSEDRRCHCRREHRNPARRRSMLTFPAKQRPTPLSKSDRRSAVPRSGTRSTSSRSTISPTRLISPSSARRSTPMSIARRLRSCRGSLSSVARCRSLAPIRSSRRPTCLW